MTDPKQIAETVAELGRFSGDGHTRFNGKTMCERAADLLQSLAAENAALKAEAEAAAARLVEVETNLNAVQRAHVIRVEACIAEEDRAEAAEAQRDRLAAELAEARAVLDELPALLDAAESAERCLSSDRNASESDHAATRTILARIELVRALTTETPT